MPSEVVGECDTIVGAEAVLGAADAGDVRDPLAGSGAPLMVGWLAVLGVIVVVVASVLGIVSGELKQIEDDPDFKRQREAEERERRRQQAWRNKWK